MLLLLYKKTVSIWSIFQGNSDNNILFLASCKFWWIVF